MKRLFPLCLFLIGLSWLTWACRTPLPEPSIQQKTTAAKTLFAKQLASCVDDNQGDYAIEQCICATAARWGKDAGACK